MTTSESYRPCVCGSSPRLWREIQWLEPRAGISRRESEAVNAAETHPLPASGNREELKAYSVVKERKLADLLERVEEQLLNKHPVARQSLLQETQLVYIENMTLSRLACSPYFARQAEGTL